MTNRFLLFKKTTVAAQMLALFAVLPGCGQRSDQREEKPLLPIAVGQAKGNVSVWSWNVAAESLKAISPAYTQSHPTVKVSVDMTGASMTLRLMLSLAADTGAPDISQLQLIDAPRYISTGRLTDLTPVAEKYRDSFPPSLWDNCVSNGRVYAIPWDMGPCAVFYKRDIFAKYGIDPAKIDTWDDYIAAGKTIYRLSGGQTKMMPLASGDLARIYFILLQQSRGQVFDDRGRIAIDSPQSLAALNLIQKMMSSGICSNVPIFGEEWMAGINDNSIASYPGAVWMAGMIEDTSSDAAMKGNVWSVFRLPAIEHGGLRVANDGGSVLVIPEQSTQKEAAWSFIEYALCSKQGQIAQYEKKSLFPGYLPAMQSAAVSAPQPFFGGQRTGALFATDVDKIPHLNLTGNWDEASGYISQALSHWYASGMDDPHLLKELAVKLSQRLNVPIAPGSQK